MTTNYNKKNSLCKYYNAYGDCFHGDNCQYIHSRDSSAPLASVQQQQQQQQDHQPSSHMPPTAPNSQQQHPPISLPPQHHQHQQQQQQHHHHHHHQPPQQQQQQSTTTSTTVFPTSAAVAATAMSTHQTTSFTLPEETKELKDDILRRQKSTAAASNANLMPTDAEILENLPEQVQDYVDLYPMERAANLGGRSNLISSVFGFITSLYRATNLNTNQTVCLRRVHSFQPNKSNAKSLLGTVDAWRKVHCANMVRLLHVFTTEDFGDNSLVLVYQYFPHAITMMQQYFSDPVNSGMGASGNSIYGFSATNRPYSQQHAILKTRLLPENLLWHYIIQLSASLRLIHSQGLAYRVLDPTKILITTSIPKCQPSQLQPSQYPRIRLNSCGLFDLVSHDHTIQDQTNTPKEFYQQLQLDDLVSFGRFCLALATNSLTNAKRENWETALELVTRTYSGDLKALIVTLLSSKQPTTDGKRRTVNDIMPMIGARFYVQLNLSYEIFDNAQVELEREALNGKLFRLLVKISMINDRPELRLDPSWSETGDRYMLKLFREYLFHQLNEDGTPWLDTGHVVSTLLKFDAGSQEKICLISRDEQHVVVVSFAELKKCFENAFNDLQT